MTNADNRTELPLDHGGLWAIHSPSPTVVYLDLDNHRLLRDRRGTSFPMPHDHEWVPLIQVTSPRGDHTIRVGDRHEYLTDPNGGLHDYRWYIPQVCTSIEPLTPSDLPEHARRPGPTPTTPPREPA